MTVDEYFVGFEDGKRLFIPLNKMIGKLGDAELRVTKSQIAFRRKKTFAWAWTPRRHLKGKRRIAPLVLSVGFRQREPSLRWKEIVEPYPGRFMHHLELWSPSDIDAEVLGWLRTAWELAA
ncbi:MAG: DUF5655 domain-containing protein [Anaerolineales bacterium]